MQNNDSLEKQVEEIAAEITNGQFKRALDFIGNDKGELEGELDGVRHHLLWNHLGSLIEGDEEAIPAVYEFTREQFARYASANPLDEPTMDLLDTLAVMTGFYASCEETGLKEALDACNFFKEASDALGIVSQEYAHYPLNRLKQALRSRGVLHPGGKAIDVGKPESDFIGFTGLYERVLYASGGNLKVRIPTQWAQHLSDLLSGSEARACVTHGLIEITITDEPLGEDAPFVVFEKGYCSIPQLLAAEACLRAKEKAVLCGWGNDCFCIGSLPNFKAWEQKTTPIIP